MYQLIWIRTDYKIDALKSTICGVYHSSWTILDIYVKAKRPSYTSVDV